MKALQIYENLGTQTYKETYSREQPLPLAYIVAQLRIFAKFGAFSRYRHFLSAVIFLTTKLSTYQRVVAMRQELCKYLS